VSSPSLLSAETSKNLTFATQDIAESDYIHKTPPAQEARAALSGNPEFGDPPFEAFVSAIARGEALPAVSPSQPDHEQRREPL
jgi:hypothetical protein